MDEPLTPRLLGWADQGLVIDVAVHVGTLGAVVLYMHREIWDMLAGVGRMLKGRRDRGAKLAGLVIDHMHTLQEGSTLRVAWTA